MCTYTYKLYIYIYICIYMYVYMHARVYDWQNCHTRVARGSSTSDARPEDARAIEECPWRKNNPEPKGLGFRV